MPDGDLFFLTRIKARQVHRHGVVYPDPLLVCQQHQGGGGAYYLGQGSQVEKGGRIHFRGLLERLTLEVIFLRQAISFGVDDFTVFLNHHHCAGDQVSQQGRLEDRVHSPAKQSILRFMMVLPPCTARHQGKSGCQEDYCVFHAVSLVTLFSFVSFVGTYPILGPMFFRRSHSSKPAFRKSFSKPTSLKPTAWYKRRARVLKVDTQMKTLGDVR